MEEDAAQHITIDLKRLRLRDISRLEKGGDMKDWDVMIPILARVTGKSEDEVWDWNFEMVISVQERLNDAVGDVLKKTNGAP